MYYDKKLYSGYTSYLYIIWIPYIEPSGPESDRGRSPSGVPAPGVAGWDVRADSESGTTRRERPELKGSIGEGPNHSNYSDQSSVNFVSEFRNF